MPEPTINDRPVFARLPYLVQTPPDLPEGEESIADSITKNIDSRLVRVNVQAELFAKEWVLPTYCPEEYLDWLASVLLGVEFVWWNSAWTKDQKVRLLNNIPYMRQRLGSVTLFRFLISNFDLDAELRPAIRWIVGDVGVSTALPANLGGTSFDWQIVIPERYTERSPEYKLIELIKRHFMPCWIEFSYIVVSNDYFS